MEIKKFHFEHLITQEVTDWERIVKRVKCQKVRVSKSQCVKESKHDIEAKDLKF